MTVSDIATALRNRGLVVLVERSLLLKIGPASLLTDTDRDLIRRHRPALVSFVAGKPLWWFGEDGRPNRLPAGAGPPPAAQFWCVEGAPRWTPVCEPS